MRTLARIVALAMAILLIIQAGWVMPGCGAGGPAPAPSHHHTMPAGQHDSMPLPSGHHTACQLALCSMASGCAPVALHSVFARVAHDPSIAAVTVALKASSSPLGPAAPEPPPPRA